MRIIFLLPLISTPFSLTKLQHIKSNSLKVVREFFSEPIEITSSGDAEYLSFPQIPQLAALIKTHGLTKTTYLNYAKKLTTPLLKRMNFEKDSNRYNETLILYILFSRYLTVAYSRAGKRRCEIPYYILDSISELQTTEAACKTFILWAGVTQEFHHFMRNQTITNFLSLLESAIVVFDLPPYNSFIEMKYMLSLSRTFSVYQTSELGDMINIATNIHTLVDGSTKESCMSIKYIFDDFYSPEREYMIYIMQALFNGRHTKADRKVNGEKYWDVFCVIINTVVV